MSPSYIMTPNTKYILFLRELTLSLARPILTAVALFACATHAHAARTAAGTVIDNTATLDFSIGGDPPETATSNTASFIVDELIDVTLTWQDASKVSVNSPDSGDALTFLLTNTGNGTETFTLARNNAPSVTDTFDPLSGATPIYLESNSLPGLQTGAGGDTPYPGSIPMAAEESRTLYVVSDTPTSLAIGSTGEVALTAVSTTPGAAGAAPGTVLAGLGDNGITALVGLSQAQATATGAYIVSGLTVTLAKTVSVAGGGDAAPGKTLTYTLTVNVTGSGTADNLIISDPMPAELTYVPGSLAVDSSQRTDAADADNAEFSANTVTVNFGNTVAPATYAITFNATVN